MKIIARDVEISVGDEKTNIIVDIAINDSGNLVLKGLPSVTYEMFDEELVLKLFKK